MSDCPTELSYTSTHEWVRDLGDGIVEVGITAHAAEQMGELVFVELPEVGAELAAGDEAGVVESVKTASDYYSPVSGTVIAINEDLADAPETVNSNAYHDGWLFKMRLSDDTELDELMSADDYTEAVSEE